MIGYCICIVSFHQTQFDQNECIRKYIKFQPFLSYDRPQNHPFMSETEKNVFGTEDQLFK